MRNGQIVCKCGHPESEHFATRCGIKEVDGNNSDYRRCKCRRYYPRRVKFKWLMTKDETGNIECYSDVPPDKKTIAKYVQLPCTWHRVEILVPVKQNNGEK